MTADSNLTRLELELPLTVRLLREPGSAPLACEPVLPADFADVASEAWRDGCLRAGHPGARLSDTPMRLSPIPADDSESRCAGFKVRVLRPDGTSADCVFTFGCLRHVANRVADLLLKSGVLKAGESYFYEVIADQNRSAPSQQQENARLGQRSLRTQPLSYLNLPIRPLLQRSTPVALLEEELFPVFYTEEAFANAEACARRGTAREVETGGVLFGSLAACPESGEFFVIVRDVIEVQEAEENQFSLTYSSTSWLRLRRIQEARQAAFPSRADRLIGQSHGHPFRPNDGKVCAECERRITCSLTSAFVSPEDQAWHKAVFARQPWALCHIFGLSARGEPVHQLFGLKDGRLCPRGFYLLPELPFD